MKHSQLTQEIFHHFLERSGKLNPSLLQVLTLPLYNVYTLLQNNEDLTTLLSAVDLTDLPSTLNGKAHFLNFDTLQLQNNECILLCKHPYFR